MRSKLAGMICIGTTIRLYEIVVKARPASARQAGGRTIPNVGDLLLVLIVVLVIVLILRGPKTLPEIGRMFGRGVREAREEINKVRSDDQPPGDETKSA